MGPAIYGDEFPFLCEMVLSSRLIWLFLLIYFWQGSLSYTSLPASHTALLDN